MLLLLRIDIPLRTLSNSFPTSNTSTICFFTCFLWSGLTQLCGFSKTPNQFLEVPNKYGESQLRNPPADMAQRRQELPAGFTLSLEDHDSYWPFVSNVWSITTPANKAATERSKIEPSWWHCRLSRQPDAPTASGIVNSSRRDHTRTKCEVRIKVAKNLDTGIVSYTRTMASEGREHSHSWTKLISTKPIAGSRIQY